jgi:hypothetical protein
LNKISGKWIFYILFFFQICLLPFLQCQKYELCIAAIFQNEARFLKEWVEFHKSVGVEHFWLYNNNSTDNFHEILQPYIESGLIELIEWPSVQEENDWKHFCFEVKTGAYNDALRRACKVKAKWLALIDIDEFIFSPERKDIRKILNEYFKDVSSIYVNRQTFGMNDITELASGESLLKNMISKGRKELSYLCKSIVKPKCVKFCANPHYCKMKKGHHIVNGEGNKIPSYTLEKLYIDKIRINHYWTRDRKYFLEVKIPRYQKWGNTKESLLKRACELDDEVDFTINRWMN